MSTVIYPKYPYYLLILPPLLTSIHQPHLETLYFERNLGLVFGQYLEKYKEKIRFYALNRCWNQGNLYSKTKLENPRCPVLKPKDSESKRNRGGNSSPQGNSILCADSHSTTRLFITDVDNFFPQWMKIIYWFVI